MASGFSWLDFAEEDRQKMLNVIQLFKEQEARDELGIGVVRDAFADYFFPGTSTIQTRARYMLFIPWIYLKLEEKKTPPPEIAKRVRNDETKLIFALLKSGDEDGVIGRLSKEHLVRLPSNIYWNGLWAWGIRLFPGTQEEYHRHFGNYCRQKGKNDLENLEETDPNGMSPNWHRGIPSPPDDFLDHAELELPPEEAIYLQERIFQKQGQTLLDILAREPKFIQTDFIWNHPVIPSLPTSLKVEIAHAQNFSDSIYGAALTYNLMLSELRNLDESIKTYHSELEKWTVGLTSRWDELITWYKDLNAFWACSALRQARITLPTQIFIKGWMKLVFEEASPHDISRSEIARRMIHDREVLLKRKRARLENPRARELWSGASGAYRLDYRWGNAGRILEDILTGLGRRSE